MGEKVQTNIKPPFLAVWILTKFTEYNDKFHSVGDFQENYSRIVGSGSVIKAKLWYWSQVLKSIVPFCAHSIRKSLRMSKNYIKITLRNIKRHKGYAFLNIFGLAVGMTVCILIMLYVNHELSYDKFHKNSDRIYRMSTSYKVGDTERASAGTPGAVSKTASEEIPEIESAIRIFDPLAFINRMIVKFGEILFEDDGILVSESNYFEFFDFEFIKGDPGTAITQPGSIVITESTAARIFGDIDPIGKLINIENPRLAISDFNVSAVIKDIPDNSHFSFKYMVSTSSLDSLWRSITTSWGTDICGTYMLLKNDVNTADLEEKIIKLYRQNTNGNGDTRTSDRRFHLMKMTDIHLKSHLRNEPGVNSNISYLYSFSLIAFFILTIACTNFMNLMTACSANRAKEVGMRKVLGAVRGQLIKQFICESLIFSLLGLLLAIVIASSLLPAFNSIAGLNLSTNDMMSSNILVLLFFMAIITGIFAGSYPAFFLSSYKPIITLKGTSGNMFRKIFFRKVMIIFQFTVSVALIAGTIIVYKQLHFMRNKTLGFDKEQTLVVVSRERSNWTREEIIGNSFTTNPNIFEYTASSSVPGSNMNALYSQPEGYEGDTRFLIKTLAVDYNFLPMYKIELLNGRIFSPDFSTEYVNCIINETAVTMLGWEDNAIGKNIQSEYHNNAQLNVIGVIKDFHQFSPARKIEPMIIYLRPDDVPYPLFISLKVNTDKVSETVSFIKARMKEFEPARDFEYFFLDEHYDSQYRKEDKISTIFTYFSFLTVFVACLGLIGLAAYMAEQKKKEISIRKVLGATEGGLIYKFSHSFTANAIIGNIIAAPITYYLINKYWLINFSYRTSISPWIFVLTGIIAICIALISVGYQAIKAAYSNPVHCLRDD